MRIVVTSDTHCRAKDGSDLPAALLTACTQADLIVHLGDVTESGTLDRLESIAPLMAVRGNADRAGDPRLDARARTLDREGVRIGILNELTPQAGADIARLGDVGVVLHGNTHRESIELVDGILYINPGSPTLPAPSGAAPSFARLEVAAGAVRVEMVHLG